MPSPTLRVVRPPNAEDAERPRVHSHGGPWERVTRGFLALYRVVDSSSDQAFQQELELADFDLDVEGVVGEVEDRDGQAAVVAVALEHADDAAVLDLALADPDLELVGALAGVAEVDVLDVGVEAVVVAAAVRPLDVVAGVERQAEAGDGLAKLDGDGRVGGQGVRVGLDGEHQALA